jgi:hypothetical protein
MAPPPMEPSATLGQRYEAKIQHEFCPLTLTLRFLFVCAIVQDARGWSLSRNLTSASEGRRLDLRRVGRGSESCSVPWNVARGDVSSEANRRAMFES